MGDEALINEVNEAQAPRHVHAHTRADMYSGVYMHVDRGGMGQAREGATPSQDWTGVAADLKLNEIILPSIHPTLRPSIQLTVLGKVQRLLADIGTATISTNSYHVCEPTFSHGLLPLAQCPESAEQKTASSAATDRIAPCTHCTQLDRCRHGRFPMALFLLTRAFPPSRVGSAFFLNTNDYLGTLSCRVLSCPVQSCSVLFYPVLSCSILSCPVLSCSVLQCSHDSISSLYNPISREMPVLDPIHMTSNSPSHHAPRYKVQILPKCINTSIAFEISPIHHSRPKKKSKSVPAPSKCCP